MASTSRFTLYYVHDPMCSWCYGFAPVWQQVKSSLPAGIQLVSLVGGLAPDSDVPMPLALREKLKATWHQIENSIPGAYFNFDFWTRNVPRRSTYPACRAVICAREMAAKEEQMIAGIQQAYYQQAENPSDLDTLISVADSIGLNAEAFRQKIQSTSLNENFMRELQRVQALGVFSFPSLVIEAGQTKQDIKVDYNSAQALLDSFNRFVATH